LLKIVNLHKYYNYYPSQISGGMKRRVSLVRALSANPDIIIMDESFSFLDAAMKEKLYVEVLKVWQFSKKTLILITHDIEEAILLSSRIIILSGKPSKIKRIINVDLKRPRNFNMKYTQKCVKLRKIIEKYLDNNEY
jgi:NitT/TauT family transport system ATP-binding protein